MHWKNREVLIFSSLQKPSWKQLCTEIWRLFFLSFFVLLQKKLGINLIQMQAACNNNLIMVDRNESAFKIWILGNISFPKIYVGPCSLRDLDLMIVIGLMLLKHWAIWITELQLLLLSHDWTRFKQFWKVRELNPWLLSYYCIIQVLTVFVIIQSIFLAVTITRKLKSVTLIMNVLQ